MEKNYLFKKIFIIVWIEENLLIKEIKFLFPSELKQQLIQICSNLQKKDKLDIEILKFNFPNIFWSLFFYFDLNNIDKTFM